MSEQTVEKQEEKKEEKQEEKSLPEHLKSFPGAPSQEQIDAWKTEHEEVFVSGFSPEELFVWKPITRNQWVKLHEIAAQPEAGITQFAFEEMVCDQCVLWKSTKKTWSEGKAGAASSLHEQILQNSNFLTPQAATLLVAKL